MDFDSEPLPGVLNDAIVKVDIVQPLEAHTATIIFLHGSGDVGTSFIGYAQELRDTRDDLKHVKWVIPTAKTRPCSANGLAYPLWFDIHQFRDLSTGPWDDEGILESVEAIHGLIRHEIEGYNIPPNRIVLAGLSQGSAMAVWSTLTFDYAPLAGTCALAGRLPAPDLLLPRLSKHVSEHYPFFVAHCEGDPTVPLRVGSERVVKFLREVVGVRGASRNNTGLEYMLLPGRLHFIVADPAVWALVANWLAKVIPKIAELPPPVTSVAISSR